MATPLPSKPCQRCGRPMTWRKKWAKNWDAVRYCSDACRRSKPSEIDAALEAAVVRLLAERSADSSACPSEAARAVRPDDWQALMEPARRAGRRLALVGVIVVTQANRVVDAATATGPIRYRRGPRFARGRDGESDATGVARAR